jgi:superfamily I DNA/RNA helicase
VNLETNYRCPAAVVRRSVRLIEHGTERFSKRIVPSPRARGHLIIAADPGDGPARARHLLATWYGREEGTHAILARTNSELAPYAAIALERGIAYHAADDGLLLDHPAVEGLLASGRSHQGREPASTAGAWLPALAESLGRVGREDRVVARAVLSWAAAFPSLRAFLDALAEARRRRTELRREDAQLTLATVHSTKGLEFDHVAVVGLDEGTFPSERSLSDALDRERAMEEERRLAYVAWTRARRSLLLVYDAFAPSPLMLEAFDAHELAA